MRTEVKHHLLLTPSKDHGISQGRHAGTDLDRPSPGIVKTSPLEKPAVQIPGPAGNWAVYDGGPEKYEDHHRDKASTFGNRTDDNGGCDSAELHL